MGHFAVDPPRRTQTQNKGTLGIRWRPERIGAPEPAPLAAEQPPDPPNRPEH